MFSHPVSILGYLLIALGAIMALISPSQNYQTGPILFISAAALEQIGAFLILLGVIAQGFLRLENILTGKKRPNSSERNKGSRESTGASQGTDVPEVERLEHELKKKLQNLGFNTEGTGRL